MDRFLGLPDLASEHGARLDYATELVHWLMFALFIIWGALFVYILFRFRQGRNPKASYKGLQSHISSYGEVAVALFEVVLLVGFSIPLYSERVDDIPDEAESTVVRVVAEQFAWNIHYPGPDGEFGMTRPDLVDVESNPIGLDRDDPAAADDVTTVNQLHLPVDKPAVIHLLSKDVIHSFFIMAMRIKQDAIPGMQFPVWFVPTVTTDEMREKYGDDFNYEIGCSQLCGLGHYRMRGFATIHTQEAYDAWMAEEQSYLSEDSGDDFWG
ncbi:MAG: cytochrome c oxidase subunit II [Acidobacteriota bacterium]